jgi:hypothetical protein
VQRHFLDVVNGRAPDKHGWLTHVRDHAKGGGQSAEPVAAAAHA